MGIKLLGHYQHIDHREQTLEEHCKNVANLSSEFLRTSQFSRTGKTVGMLHDMGKACDKFQNHMLHHTIENIDHATVGAKYLSEYERSKNSLIHISALQQINMCIMSHHTGLENFLDSNGISKYLSRLHKEMDTYEEATKKFLQSVYDKDDIHKHIELCEQEFTEFIQKLNERYDESFAEMKYFEFSLLGRLMFSSLIDADRKDSADFDQGILEADQNNNEQIPWHTYYDHVMKYLSTMKQESYVNQIRSEISDLCDEAGKRPSGIYELSVPTGGGKTIASLRFALRHAMTHPNIKHIYYVIPYNTILNQNSETIKDILFPDGDVSDREFLLHNSSVVPSDEDQYRAYTERWNSHIIMTSSVHFLNSLFNGRKQDARRMHQLSDSIIILDEIQCLPEKIIHMFNTAANFLHYTCNSTMLLCTATQPRLHDFSKPIQLSESSSLIPNFEQYYEKLKRVDIISKFKENGYTIQEFTEFALAQIDQYKSALIVMNTKAQASNVYSILKERISNETSIYHLSTSMCVQHRQDQLQEIIQLLKENKPVVLVSTNLIEAGVDVSFPLGIRAMAGLENALQLAGRVNRNGELIYENGKVFVLNINDNEESNTYLKFIELKKRSMKFFLDEFREDPEAFNHDLGSLASMKTYFDIYNNLLLEDKSGVLDYKINQGCTLYDLLSFNEKGRRHYHDLSDSPYPLPLAFAYQEAGQKFCVIDQETVDVIVPYGKGKDIISDLLSGTKDNDNLKRLLKEAQNYTVGLYPYQLQELKDHITMIEGIEVRILDMSNYDEDLGVVLNGECLGMFI